ncbi:hypothetical protein Q427_09575 [Halomonas sp. BC04]|nr:hypothetical protein Q427_09575 [Halomonas sp. BC04]
MGCQGGHQVLRRFPVGAEEDARLLERLGPGLQLGGTTLLKQHPACGIQHAGQLRWLGELERLREQGGRLVEFRQQAAKLVVACGRFAHLLRVSVRRHADSLCQAVIVLMTP